MSTDVLHARQVEAIAAYGIPEDAIAKVLGITPTDLRLRYADEPDTGSTKANSRVAENLYRRATGEGRDAVTAAIFWLKTRAGWRESRPYDADDGKEPLIVNIVRFADLPEQSEAKQLPPPRNIER